MHQNSYHRWVKVRKRLRDKRFIHKEEGNYIIFSRANPRKIHILFYKYCFIFKVSTLLINFCTVYHTLIYFISLLFDVLIIIPGCQSPACWGVLISTLHLKAFLIIRSEQKCCCYYYEYEIVLMCSLFMASVNFSKIKWERESAKTKINTAHVNRDRKADKQIDSACTTWDQNTQIHTYVYKNQCTAFILALSLSQPVCCLAQYYLFSTCASARSWLFCCQLHFLVALFCFVVYFHWAFCFVSAFRRCFSSAPQRGDAKEHR